MGHVYATLTCHGTGGTASLRLLVDTGASYTWLPAPLLKSLGVRPTRSMPFELGDNRVVRRRVGELLVETQGIRATTVVVFAGPKDANVIGVHALEGLALGVDSRRERLRPMEKLLFIPAVMVAG